MIRKKLVNLLLASTLAIGAMAAPATAQWAVFDGANYAQNVLEAARALQQINNQIQSLQNEATMLTNMATNLKSLNVSSLSSIVTDLTQISTLMNKAQGISFNVSASQAAFAQTYPQNYTASTTSGTLGADALKRWQDAMAAFRQTLTVQSQVAQNVQSDTTTLTTLVTASQGAVGSLQVAQATNQLLALSIKQQLQIQNLMAAQYRASSLEQGRSAEAQSQSQAAFSNFLGTGQAYTPH